MRAVEAYAAHLAQVQQRQRHADMDAVQSDRPASASISGSSGTRADIARAESAPTAAIIVAGASEVSSNRILVSPAVSPPFAAESSAGSHPSDQLQVPRADRERRDSVATVSTIRTFTSGGQSNVGRSKLEEILARRRALPWAFQMLRSLMLTWDRILHAHGRKLLCLSLFVMAFTYASWVGFSLLITLYVCAVCSITLFDAIGMMCATFASVTVYLMLHGLIVVSVQHHCCYGVYFC